MFIFFSFIFHLCTSDDEPQRERSLLIEASVKTVSRGRGGGKEEGRKKTVCESKDGVCVWKEKSGQGSLKMFVRVTERPLKKLRVIRSRTDPLCVDSEIWA